MRKRPSLLCHRGLSGRWCSRQSRHLHPSSRKEQIMAAEKPVAPRGASKRSNTIGQDAGTRPRNAAQSAPEATKKVKSIDPSVLQAASPGDILAPLRKRYKIGRDSRREKMF